MSVWGRAPSPVHWSGKNSSEFTTKLELVVDDGFVVSEPVGANARHLCTRANMAAAHRAHPVRGKDRSPPASQQFVCAN
jgi:hypothetical protein